MEILGIGPSELVFIVIIALIVLGPKDMQKAGKTIGKFLRDIVTSDAWTMFQKTSRELRTLPNRLMRDANDELNQIGNDINNATNPAANRFNNPNSPLRSQSMPTNLPENKIVPTTTNQKQTKAIKKKMRKFFSGLWQVVTRPFHAIYNQFPEFFNKAWRVIIFPFQLVFNILAFPFRKIYQFYKFLNTEPEERPLTEVFIDLTTNKDTREMLWDQIEALRMHLLRAVLALVLTVSVSFLFTQKIIDFLAQPIGGLDKLIAIEVTESISVFMKVALLSGIALAIPYIAFEIWWFAAPGLKPRERKMGLVGIPFAAIFFLGGAAFTFFIMLPAALPFLNSFMNIKTELRPQSYFSFVTGLMLWIGLAFEFPLVIYVLSAMGFIKPQILVQQWRLAIVIIAIVAAAITPTIDPVNQGLVMAPMILLYFISIGLSYIAYAGRKQNQADDQKKADETVAD